VVMTSPNAVAHAMTAVDMKAQIQRIQQVMRSVMKDGTHYGKIPGAGDKKTLFKPGAEVLCATFRIAPTYRVDDLSTDDCIRYRVTCVATHQATGVILGEGMGEASSNEEKYKWRNAVCDEEFDETDDDRRRVKWQKGWNNNPATRRPQVRTEPADIANTVLKMACKRAQVAMTLNVTAASDIFTQDLEDMPEELRGSADDQHHQEEPSRQQRSTRPQTQAPRARANGNGGDGRCTEAQVRLLRTRLNGAGIPEPDFLARFEINAVEDLPFAKVNDALQWIADALAES
jgi:hypothetical protein